MQRHVYELGLLGGRCSDIRIRAFGRIYHLHRLVLIQSGFFRAMLCGGFAEDLAAASAAAKLSKNNSSRDARASTSSASASASNHKDTDGDVVDLHFDDPNISRAAFEYCIARLYGNGPKLVLPFWSTPSPSHPFSPAFTMRSSQSSQVEPANLLIDKRSHPATPRFLLSLLATSIYLNIPSVTSQALTLVLCSITPYNVVQYLRFAVGHGIEGTDLHRSASDVMSHDLDEWDWELEGPARTLEEIARPDPSQISAQHSQCSPRFHNDDASGSDDFAADFSRKLHVTSAARMARHDSATSSEGSPLPIKQGRPDMPSTPSKGVHATSDHDKPSPKKTAGFRDSGKSSPVMPPTRNATPEYQYGLIADKIGEACACWFARWGYDIYELELSMERERIVEIETWIRMCREDRDIARLALLRERLHTGDVDLLHTSMLPRGRMPDPSERMPSPRLRVWSYPSMPSSWVRAVISSDSFFVPSEFHRYEFAKKVVELRRKQKALINVLDRLIDDWMREDHAQNKAKECDVPDSTLKMGGDAQPCGSSSRSSDAGDGFGFKAFRRTSSFGTEGDLDPTRTPVQEAWDDGMGSTTYSASIDQDETEYEELFSSGIYYSHMPFNLLRDIEADVSPVTGRPYAPIDVLQTALWNDNELRSKILENAYHIRQSTTQNSVAGGEASGSSDTLNQEAEEDLGELGISATTVSFRNSFDKYAEQLQSPLRWRHSRSGVPPTITHSGSDRGLDSGLGLGGLTPSSSLFGPRGSGPSASLGRRFYLVPSDDTIRFGDGLMSVLGVTSNASQNASRVFDDDRGSVPAIFGDDQLGPSGTAATQIPHTLPISAIVQHEASSASHPRRDRSHFYCLANQVALGHELGESASRFGSSVSERTRGSAARYFGESDVRRSSAGDSTSHSHVANQDANDTDSLDSAGESQERWTGYEPMRVGVEFFGIDKLQEKQRLYSPSFFYAGSMWNLYIQVVKKAKGIQLGVYLHRQSLMEKLPPPSAPTPGETEPVPGLTSETPWPTLGPSLARDTATVGTWTPRGSQEQQQRPHASRSTGGAHRTGARSSVPLGTAANDDDGGAHEEGHSSFFDTSFASPIRAGGHGGSANVDIGSTITLANGRSVTRAHTSTHDPFAPADAHQEQSERATASSEGAASKPAQDTIVPLYENGPSVHQSWPTPSVPYQDARKELRAYFSIHCPSPLGTALTKFSSGPDKFTISQSWGWKSSSLLGTVHLDQAHLDSAKAGAWYRFRCVCTIGLV